MMVIDEAREYAYKTIVPRANELVLDREDIVVETREYETLRILNWNWDYEFYRNNDNILVEEIGWEEDAYRVYWRSPWTSILEVRDGYGMRKSVRVTIEEALEIVEFEYTPIVEAWYIWWIYFKVNNPDLIREVWVEYYDDNDDDFSKDVLENEWDWEFASFVLPKTRFTRVRWYVIDEESNKFYTDYEWSIIESELALSDYYNIESWQTISSFWNNRKWIRINAIPLIPVLLFIGWFGVSAYSSYRCDQEEWWINLSCWIAVGTTIVSLVWLWRSVVKSAVTKFASKRSVEKVAEELWKESVDDVARLWVLLAHWLNKNIIIESALRSDRNGFTIVWRSLQKHSNRVWDIFQKYLPLYWREYNDKWLEILKFIILWVNKSIK